jgi:uncharacterized protein (TIGR03067 family)
MKILHQWRQWMMVVLLLACLSGCSKTKASLDGRWTGSMLGVSDAEFTLIINGDQMDFHCRGSEVDNWLRGSIVLNEMARPKEMDLQVEEASNYDNLGSKILLIYDLQGDELKLAATTENSTVRPTNFAGAEGIQVFFLKRTKNEPNETGAMK